jgi:hypothetical protein
LHDPVMARCLLLARFSVFPLPWCCCLLFFLVFSFVFGLAAVFVVIV